MSDIEPGTALTHRRTIDGSATELWSDTARFHAVVDSVDGDYVEATVTRGNRHYRTPDNGAGLALSRAQLADSEHWEVGDQ